MLRRFRRDDRAAAMVEFAIVAPLLFVLLFGIIDFGRVFLLYNNLANAVREGARLGAVRPEGGSIPDTIRTAVRARINDANRNRGAVTVSYQGAAGLRTVRVSVDTFPFTPITFLAMRSVRKLNVKAEFRLEQQ